MPRPSLFLHRLPWTRRRLLQLAGGGALAPLLPALEAMAGPGVAPKTGTEGGATTLWYPQPAAESRLLLEGLPVGNGHLGALVSGDPADECLYITDASLWTGGRNDRLDAKGQFPYEDGDFGSFGLLAKLRLSLSGHAAPEAYRRELDLQQGCASVRHRQAGVEYRREVYASHPDRVLVLRLVAGDAGRHHGTLALEGTRGQPTRASGGGVLAFDGRFDNGLRYAACAGIAHAGGRLVPEGGRLRFENCRALTVVFSAATSHSATARGFIDPGIDPAAVAAARLRTALAKPAQILHDAHVADHRALFDAMQLELGASTPAQRKLDTWSRLQARAQSNAPDPELEAQYLQFGRYLAIAGSRDGLPTSLQGLWVDSNDLPWFSDYHTDVNLQMNYWLPDRAGLPQCFDALAEYCIRRLPLWTQVTRERYNDPRNRFRNSSGKVAGWTTAISLNAYGGNGWWWHPAGNAWLCLSLWEHWEYTQDRAYLARILPLLRGACEFWEARLLETEVREPDGSLRRVLVDDHDWSPEHGPEDARGIGYAQELVHALFGHYADACRRLGRDADYAANVASLRTRLYLPRVLPDGVLEEWMGAHDLGEPQHRHLSQLMGLFPGDRIRNDLAPAELVAGARRSLQLRGKDSYGWANAWRALCWARLREGNTAYDQIIANLSPWKPGSKARAGTSANLFDIYASGGKGIFQIDANYGAAAAMLEMLLYSRPGRIELLPALPRAWPNGEIRGLGARGGFALDLVWRDRQAVEVAIRSAPGGTTELVHGGRSTPIRLTPGQQLRLRANDEGALQPLREAARNGLQQVPGNRGGVS